MSNKRPENTLPPELYYDEIEAQKYTSNTHIMEVQSRISERALELLALPNVETCILLDIGCGSGLSGESITEAGHCWIGIDISQAMLKVAHEREVEGDLLLGDIGCGLPFKAGSFDGAISISALQWLCHSDKSSHNPVVRIRRFFSSLYACLSRSARAVLQFYPESVMQADLLQSEAIRAGFNGGLVIDFPNSTRAKKYFLVLDVSCSSRAQPVALGEGGEAVSASSVVQGRLQALRDCRRTKRLPKHGVAWIKAKKERARKQMKQVAHDSKYTGRKRPTKF